MEVSRKELRRGTTALFHVRLDQIELVYWLARIVKNILFVYLVVIANSIGMIVAKQ